MHPNLTPLAPLLLTNLGCSSEQLELAQFLENLPHPHLNLRQHRNGELYAYSVEPYGLDLMLQCTNPQAEPAHWHWGLHSITLHTVHSQPQGYWTSAWPQDLQADTATAQDIVNLFKPDPEEILHTPLMTCFSVAGMDEQTWALTCLFDPSSQQLSTLSLIRTGDWIEGVTPTETETQEEASVCTDSLKQAIVNTYNKNPSFP